MFGRSLSAAILLVLFVSACNSAEPTATAYKEQLGNGAASQKPVTPSTNKTGGTDTTAPAGNAPAGNAQTGLTILSANCTNCHTGSLTLSKTSVLDGNTVKKIAHKGLEPVFTDANIADIKAALARS